MYEWSDRVQKDIVGSLYFGASEKFGSGYMSDCFKTIKAEKDDLGVVEVKVLGQMDNLICEISTDIDESLHKFLYLIDGNLYLIRIRKLIPKECWSLMDFTENDFISAEKVVSNSQLYKQAGNSIVKRVLMAIIGQMIPGKENVYKEI